MDLVDKALLLARAPLFGGLDEAALLELAGAARPVEASAGDALEGGALYLVTSGRLRGAAGDLGPGAIAGERGVLGADERLHCVADARLLRLDADDLLDALALHPALAAELCALLGRR